MVESEFHTHSIEGTHDDHGAYTIECRVVEDDRYVVRPDRSDFPIDDLDAKLDCIDHAEAALNKGQDDERHIAYNAEVL